MSSIRFNLGAATFGRVIVNALGFFVLALLTRMLGPDGFGHYSTIFAILFFVVAASDVGLATLLTREISRPLADEARIVGLLVTLRLIIVVLATVVGGLVVWFLPYPPLIRAGVLIASLGIISQSISQMLMGIFQKHLRIAWVALADIMARLIQLLGLAVLMRYGMEYLQPVLWVNVIAEVVHIAILSIAARRLVPFVLMIDVEYWKAMLRTAFPIAASLVFTLIYFKIDTIMLSLMRTPAEVGIYGVAYKVLEVIIFFPAMYIGLIMPFLSKHAHERTEFLRIFWRAFRVLTLGAVATVAGLILFAGPIMHLIGGGAFAGSASVLQILSLGIGLIFLGNLGGNAIIALDLQRQAMWAYGAGAVLNVVLNLVFIPKYGYYAAAWTTVATELVVTGGMFWLIRKKWTEVITVH